MTAQLAIDWNRETDERDLERLVPLARDLAEKAGREGVTVENVRRAAVSRGLLTGEEQGRALSYLGGLMKRAGLVSTGQYRRSGIGKAHGNLNMVWVDKRWTYGYGPEGV